MQLFNWLRGFFSHAYFLIHKYSVYKYNKLIITNNNEKKMLLFWIRNKSEIDAKIVTERQNWRDKGRRGRPRAT